MGQELNGSLGSWVTVSDPFPALDMVVCTGTHPRVPRGGYAPVSYKCSAVAEMGDRSATIDISRKLAGCAPFWGRELDRHVTQCGLDRGLPSYQVAS